MIKKSISIILVICLSFTFLSCSKIEKDKKNRYDAQFLVLFDTLTRVVGYAETKDDFEEMSQLIYDSLKHYNDLYDIYNSYEGINNIKTLNEKASQAPVVVDKEIINLIKISKEVESKYGDKFNIALGSVLKIWHDYRTEGIDYPEKAQVPPIDALREASLHTNLDDVVIDEENSTVYFSDPELQLDVGSIAKGYATERVAQILKENGYDGVLISVGGNIRAVGAKPEGDNIPWNVGIQDPDDDKNMLVLADIIDKSIVTSGDYQRYYYVGDQKYHHIIDTDTLFPNNYYRAVSILCEDSGFADALSTIAFNLPFEESKKLIDGIDDVEAMWVMPDKEIRYSDGFKQYIKE